MDRGLSQLQGTNSNYIPRISGVKHGERLKKKGTVQSG